MWKSCHVGFSPPLVFLYLKKHEFVSHDTIKTSRALACESGVILTYFQKPERRIIEDGQRSC